MNNGEKSFLMFMDVLNDPAKYQKRIDELNKLKDSIEKAQKKAHAEINMAAEASAMISSDQESLRTQANELFKLEEKLEAKEKRLDVKSKKLTEDIKEDNKLHMILEILEKDLQDKKTVLDKAMGMVKMKEVSLDKKLKAVSEKEAKLKEYFNK